MARPQVRDVSAPERIQGIAAPVSTYVRPADPGKSQLHELAEGLAAFDQGLSGFMADRKQETDAADKAKAITDFHRNNQMGYAEAVRTGVIPPTASKSYVEWYKKQQGHLAGLKLSDKFALDYQQWGGRDSGDPDAFGKWVGGWMSQNVGQEQDPYILAGLAPHLDNLASTGYDTFNRDRAASLRSKANATSGALVTDALVRGSEAGRAEGSIDYDGLWGGMMSQREEAIAAGEKGEDFDKLMVDSIILQAEESGNSDMLKLLDKTLPGQELPMSRGPEVREKRLRARDRITNKQASLATDIGQAREKAEKKDHEAGLAEAVLKLSNGEEVPEELIQRLSRRDGEIRFKLQKYKKEYQDLDTEEDPSALMHIYEQIDGGAGQAFVNQMRDKGVIRNPATYQKMVDRAKANQKATGDGGVFTSPTYKDTVKLITNATGEGDFSSLDGVKGLSPEGMEALYDYRNMLLEWDMRNPDSTLLEKEKASKEIGDVIRSRIKADPSGNLAGTYESEADAAKAKEASTPVPSNVPAAVPPKEAPGGYTQGIIPNLWDMITGGDEAQAPQEQSSAPATPFQNLKPETQQSIQAFAAKKGLSVEDAYKELTARTQRMAADPGLGEYNPLNLIRNATESFRDGVSGFEQSMGAETQGRPASEAPEPASFNPMSLIQTATEGFRNGVQAFEQSLGGETQGVAATDFGNVSEDTRSKLTSLLQDPPKVARLTASNVPVAPLLSLIGNTEGTDKRNGYNETLGYGAYTGGDVNLVGMSLGEIDKLQTQMLRHPKNAWNSSAIGRYQIVRTTLRGLKEEMGLTDDMKFTPELQDKMAMQLLERRGLSKWQAGQMSDDQFINGLSAEWASLPKSNGRGTYTGQRVGTTVDGLRGALGQIKGTEVASLDPSIGVPSGDPYANIPDKDGTGVGGQKAKFLEWNPDPLGNHEENLRSIDPSLASVVSRAREIAGVKFVVGSGKRTPEMQKKAVKWGWSKTEESDHLDGSSVDLWPVDERGAVKFDPAMQQEVVMAMKLAAKELGVALDIGAEWKSFKDKPHFGIKHKG